jgi:hypothetical protein
MSILFRLLQQLVLICSDTTFVFVRDDTQNYSHYNWILFEQLFSFIPTLFLFEMTYKLVLAIVISCFVYNNNLWLTHVLICSDIIFIVRDDI